MTQYCCTVSHRSSNKTAHIVSLPSKERLVWFFYGQTKVNIRYIGFPECLLILNPFMSLFQGCARATKSVSPHLAFCCTTVFVYLLDFFHIINSSLRQLKIVILWCHGIFNGLLGVSQKEQATITLNLQNATPFC